MMGFKKLIYSGGVKRDIGDPLQILRDACRLYFTLDDNSRNGNVITPEKGVGTISSNSSNSVIGKINEAALIDNSNKVFIGDNSLNTNNNLINNDIFSFSLWRELKINSSVKSSFALSEANANDLNANYTSYVFSDSLDIGIATRNLSSGANNFQLRRYSLSGLTLNSLNHVYGSYNPINQESKLFINGQEILNSTLLTRGSGVNLRAKGEVSVKIGSIENSDQSLLNEKIDEIAFMYGLAPSQQLADLLYNNGNGVQLF